MSYDAPRTAPARAAGPELATPPTREFAFQINDRGVVLRVAVQVFAEDPAEVGDTEETAAEAGYGHGV